MAGVHRSVVVPIDAHICKERRGVEPWRWNKVPLQSDGSLRHFDASWWSGLRKSSRASSHDW